MQREAQEVEGRATPLVPVPGRPKGEAAGLLRVEGQAECPKPFSENTPHVGRIVLVLEAQDEVVRIADERAVRFEVRTHLAFEPHVEGMVQVHVPEERGQARPLSSPFRRFEDSRPVEDANMQALPDEPHQPLVGDPVAEHLHQHLAVDVVEEGHDVCLHDVVRVPSHDHPVEYANRVVRAASGPEAIRAVQKVLLVHRLQHLA